MGSYTVNVLLASEILGKFQMQYLNLNRGPWQSSLRKS